MYCGDEVLLQGNSSQSLSELFQHEDTAIRMYSICATTQFLLLCLVLCGAYTNYHEVAVDYEQRQCTFNGNQRVIATTTTFGAYRKFIYDLNDGNVWIMQTKDALTYRSEDQGKTWKQQVFERDGFNDTVWSIQRAANSSWIYALMYLRPEKYQDGIRAGLWTTKDAGQSWTLMTSVPTTWNSSYIFLDLFPHPIDPNLAMAVSTSPRCLNFYFDGPVCYKYLWTTTDFGQTWKKEWLVQDNFVLNFVFGKYDKDNQEAIYYYVGRKNGTNSPNILLRGNLFKPEEPPVVIYENVQAIFKPPGNNHSMIFVAIDNGLGTGVYLMFSEDNGQNWIKSKFPFDYPQNGYNILDEQDGAVIMNVMHGSGNEYGHVYESNSYGDYYSLILKYNRRSPNKTPFNGNSDWSNIYGLPGIYIANVYDAETDEEVTKDTPLKTLITFDMGSEWSTLNPPLNSSGFPITTCSQKPCNLNLFGPKESILYPYSQPSAIGIALAAGNVGSTLLDPDVEINTYFTRDAGWTWTEIKKGAWIYEIGDHGGLLVLADTNPAGTKEIIFSWDEGQTWQTCAFTNTEDKVTVDKGPTAQTFIVVANRIVGDQKQFFLAHIDFTQFHERTCQYPERAGESDSDYELWSPQDARNETYTCFLGSHTAYVRRKRDSACFNPETYETIVSSKPCACQPEDYECDYCFAKAPNNTCVLSCQDYDPSKPPAVCNDFYEVTQGYRLIPGDKCDVQQGLNWLPKKVQCPKITEDHLTEESSSENPKGTTGRAVGISFAVIFAIIVLAIVVGVVLVCTLRKPLSIYAWLTKLKPFGKERTKGEVYRKLSTIDVDAAFDVTELDEEPPMVEDE